MKNWTLLGKITTLALSVCAYSVPVYSDERAKPYISLEAGLSRVGFNDLYEYGDYNSDWGDTKQLVGGVKFSNDVIVAANISRFKESSSFFSSERVEVEEYGLLLGYSFDIAKHFRIVPMVGLAFWDLEYEQTVWLSDDSRFVDDSGSDVYGKLKLQFPITDLFSLSAIYTNGQYDFGKLESQRIGVQFDF